MEMRPFLRKNLSDTVKAELYDYIDNLDLEKGTKLPPENTIAQNYGVSRVTVRRGQVSAERLALMCMVLFAVSGTLLALTWGGIIVV